MTPKERLAFNITKPEIIDKFNQLKSENKSNQDFVLELLEAYEKFTGLNCSTEHKNYFPNSGNDKDDKAAKELILKEMFELEPNDPPKITECELLKKASEISSKSIEQMSLEGRILVAKNEIGREIQYIQGKGRKGTGDDKIANTLEFMKQSGQKLSVNRLTQLSGSNSKTVKSWCERNNVTFE